MTANTTHPGLPNYTGPLSGLFSLLHHNVLYEWSDDVTARVRYIVAAKPASEQAVRLRCLVYLDPAGQPWAEGHRLWTEGNRLRTPLPTESTPLWTESDFLWNESDRLLTTHRQAIELQIRSLVPDLPWDGSQLVF